MATTHAPLVEADKKLLHRWTLLLLILGLAWRLGRFATMRPIWGDEAALDLNIMNRGLAQLFQPLDYNHVAPPLFLFLEWLMQHALGNAEWVVRLLPLLAGLTAAVLFWRWCRLLLPPLAVAVATGLFAIGFYPVRYSVELKPYAFDQLAAIGMLYLATRWILQPDRTRFAWLLALLMPVVVLGSYPAVFLAGGICVALLPTVWRSRSFSSGSAWACMSLALVGTFAVLLLLVAQGQYDRTSTYMDDYWVKGFPPSNLLGYLRWLIVTHTGDTFAYPQGGSEGGSTGTFLVFLAGVITLLRQRRWQLLVLLLAPFTLTFIAATLHRYPYGVGPRLAQHLAPAICLVTGYGTQRLLELIPQPLWRRRGAGFALVALTLFGVIAFAADLIKPYKSEGDAQVRASVREVFAPGTGQEGVYVMQPMAKVPMTFQLYLRWQQRPIIWDAAHNWRDDGAPGAIVLNFDPAIAVQALPPQLSGRWALQSQLTRKDLPGTYENPFTYCQVTFWTRSNVPAP